MSKGSNRVNRGGSWNNNARNCRSANRNRNAPGNRNNSLGFRLAFSSAHRAQVHAGPLTRSKSRPRIIRGEECGAVEGLVAGLDDPAKVPMRMRGQEGWTPRSHVPAWECVRDCLSAPKCGAKAVTGVWSEEVCGSICTDWRIRVMPVCTPTEDRGNEDSVPSIRSSFWL